MKQNATNRFKLRFAVYACCTMQNDDRAISRLQFSISSQVHFAVTVGVVVVVHLHTVIYPINCLISLRLIVMSCRTLRIIIVINFPACSWIACFKSHRHHHHHHRRRLFLLRILIARPSTHPSNLLLILIRGFPTICVEMFSLNVTATTEKLPFCMTRLAQRQLKFKYPAYRIWLCLLLTCQIHLRRILFHRPWRDP